MATRDPTRRTTRAGRLLDRVIQQRRVARTEAGRKEGKPDHEQRIAALERRVEELEALLEAFQDSVHREATRYEKEIAALDERTRGPAMARELGKYSRERRL